MTAVNPLTRELDRVLEGTSELFQELRGRRIFITGATGFFGCWLLESLAWANESLNLGAKATILTRNPRRFEERLPHLIDSGVEIIAGDIRSFAFPDGEFSHIIHAATESSVELNATQPQVMFDTILEGTRRCLEFAARCGAQKLLFTSSGAVYGNQPPTLGHIPEELAGSPDPLDPSSAYAEGKRAAELLCAVAAKQTAMEVKIARCFAFVGPYMKLDAHFAIGNFIRDHLAGGPIRVQGDGTPLRSYLYASDLVVWLWTILFRGKSCRAYNVGSEEAMCIADIAREVAAQTSPSTPVHVSGTPVPGAVAARYIPSTARAQKELGLKCTVPLREAIRRTIEWNRARAQQIMAAPIGAAND